MNDKILIGNVVITSPFFVPERVHDSSCQHLTLLYFFYVLMCLFVFSIFPLLSTFTFNISHMPLSWYFFFNIFNWGLVMLYFLSMVIILDKQVLHLNTTVLHLCAVGKIQHLWLLNSFVFIFCFIEKSNPEDKW